MDSLNFERNDSMQMKMPMKYSVTIFFHRSINRAKQICPLLSLIIHSLAMSFQVLLKSKTFTFNTLLYFNWNGACSPIVQHVSHGWPFHINVPTTEHNWQCLLNLRFTKTIPKWWLINVRVSFASPFSVGKSTLHFCSGRRRDREPWAFLFMKRAQASRFDCCYEMTFGLLHVLHHILFNWGIYYMCLGKLSIHLYKAIRKYNSCVLLNSCVTSEELRKMKRRKATSHMYC